MNKRKKTTINKAHSRLTLEQRCTIEALLNEHYSIRYIAKQLDKSPSTISREINNHLQLKAAKFNVCVNKRYCKKKQVCGAEDCPRSCNKCVICKKYCDDYIEMDCEYHPTSPHVCNGCPRIHVCTFNQKLYVAKTAHADYKNKLTDMRSGFDLTYEELSMINALVSPLIQKGQSPYHIIQTFGDKLMISESTLRRLIEQGELDARDIDLRDKVRRKPRKTNRHMLNKENISAAKQGHLYKDYLEFIATSDLHTVQMDCVEGKQDEKATLLTLHFPDVHMQLAFIMDDHTAKSVVSVFDKIEAALGAELFAQMFPIILTDNGSEFTDIIGMERSITGEQRTKIFFCEPNRSDEKGACENNHKLVRYIFPKGCSFEPYTQADISLAMNHINSYCRKATFGKSPYDIAMQMYPKDFFILLGLEKIDPEEIILNPTLFKEN